MERYYDKMLHIVLTFLAMLILLEKLQFDILNAVLITLLLQTAKMAYNFATATRYRPYGDWLANAIGYVCIILYVKL